MSFVYSVFKLHLQHLPMKYTIHHMLLIIIQCVIFFQNLYTNQPGNYYKLIILYNMRYCLGGNIYYLVYIRVDKPLNSLLLSLYMTCLGFLFPFLILCFCICLYDIVHTLVKIHSVTCLAQIICTMGKVQSCMQFPIS
jgi:hypothetical protein